MTVALLWMVYLVLRPLQAPWAVVGRSAGTSESGVNESGVNRMLLELHTVPCLCCLLTKWRGPAHAGRPSGDGGLNWAALQRRMSQKRP